MLLTGIAGGMIYIYIQKAEYDARRQLYYLAVNMSGSGAGKKTYRNNDLFFKNNRQKGTEYGFHNYLKSNYQGQKYKRTNLEKTNQTGKAKYVVKCSVNSNYVVFNNKEHMFRRVSIFTTLPSKKRKQTALNIKNTYKSAYSA